jgi:hypothetical protein
MGRLSLCIGSESNAEGDGLVSQKVDLHFILVFNSAVVSPTRPSFSYTFLADFLAGREVNSNDFCCDQTQ